MRRKEVIYSDFYCLNCGNKVVVPRSRSFQKEQFHRKRLWCIKCKVEVNHVQVRNEAEKEEFLKQFAEGAFAQEAKESITYCKESSWQW